MKKNIIFIILLFIPAAALSNDLKKDKTFPSKTFSFFFENDTFFDTDREYTNGIRVSMTYNNEKSNYGRIEKLLEKTAEKAGIISAKDSKFAYSLSIGQNIYTPEKKEVTYLVEDERPYAGFTYVAAGIICKTKTQMNTLELMVGMVGPHSFAEDIQSEIHNTFDWEKPEGWKHQLKDEPVLEILLSKKWKTTRYVKNSFGFDLIPEMGGGLGNAFTYLQAGINFRFGYNIPNDFGTPRIRPATETNFPLDTEDPRLYPKYKRFGIYVFCSAESNLVARNIFLDGNTFQDSHSVDKNLVTGTTTIGLGIIINRFNIVYGHVFNSKFYKEQKDRQYYGTMAISYSW